MGKLKLIVIAVIGIFVFQEIFKKDSLSASEQVVDLNVVLDEFIATAEAAPAPEGVEIASETTESSEPLSTEDLVAKANQAAAAQPLPVGQNAEDTAPAQDFADDFAAKLNEKPLMQDQKVAVFFQEDGSFLGFVDNNSDGALDMLDDKVFLVEVDAERDRLIATDLQHGYVRDGGLRGLGMGLMGGYLMSRMLSGQRSAGITPQRFANKNVSPRNYHQAASRNVASRVSSARSSSGSGSFRSGK